ncbi:hypothetical protein PFICI_02392 [Pestalotiopsis fici W106-1]|uniref:Uncharacterized protein n=1 Tax=Pestalotiopsis fici (strain W106-1 / CGMCC3.15140) TaxID=1229662 RepID=W3XG25_PESFW|nr:uncharacterized protein PFICI_02392 [Pestalotiopsis fici W106-1]ETS84367.1 hypothetical protein PFICI_02392 [Pestalotiopsis fici W106-1]
MDALRDYFRQGKMPPEGVFRSSMADIMSSENTSKPPNKKRRLETVASDFLDEDDGDDVDDEDDENDGPDKLEEHDEQNARLENTVQRCVALIRRSLDEMAQETEASQSEIVSDLEDQLAKMTSKKDYYKKRVISQENKMASKNDKLRQQEQEILALKAEVQWHKQATSQAMRDLQHLSGQAFYTRNEMLRLLNVV